MKHIVDGTNAVIIMVCIGPGLVSRGQSDVVRVERLVHPLGKSQISTEPVPGLEIRRFSGRRRSHGKCYLFGYQKY